MMVDFPKNELGNMKEFKILCVKLDELSIIILKTLRSIMLERKYLDGNLKEGYINMAKARYLMRGQKVGIQQVSCSNLKATLKISNYLDVSEGVEYLNYKFVETFDQQKDVNLKFRSVNREDQLDNQTSDSPVDEENCKTEDPKTAEENNCSNSSDPLKWFGLLVPESLRNCQSRFKQSVSTALNIISLQNKLRELQKDYKMLRLQKDSFHSLINPNDVVYNSFELDCADSVKS